MSHKVAFIKNSPVLYESDLMEIQLGMTQRIQKDAPVFLALLVRILAKREKMREKTVSYSYQFHFNSY